MESPVINDPSECLVQNGQQPKNNFDSSGPVCNEIFSPDLVNHPPHYTAHPSGVECIEITRNLTFNVGNAVKYVWRAEAKNGRQDLEKAQWYLRDALCNRQFAFILGGFSKCGHLLANVSEAEHDPVRQNFFDAIGAGDLNGALNAVERMLS